MNNFYSLLTEEYTGEIDPPTKEGDQESVIQNTNKGPEQVKVDIDIATTRPTEEMLAELDLVHTEKYRKELHALITREYPVMDGKVAMEGLTSWVRNVFTSMLNSLGHIVNLFKTAAFAGWKSFKRSELAEYVDSNIATYRRILKIDNNELIDFNLDIPKGMVGKYEDALNSIENTLGATQMLLISERMLSQLTDIYNDIVSGETEFTSQLLSSNSPVNLNIRSIEDALSKENKIFTNSRQITNTFVNLYGNIEMLESVVKRTISFDDHFKQVASIEERLTKTESILASMSDHPNTSKVSKETLNKMADVIKNMGFTYEAYSIAMSDLFRVNHNITLNLMKLKSQLK